MKQYVEPLMEWQPDLFRRTFDPKVVRVVILEGKPIGMLKVRAEKNTFYLGDVMISPEFQKRGFGTALVRLAMAEAKQVGLPLNLRVLKGNPAKNLYIRLGFQVIEETDTHFRMAKAVSQKREPDFRLI
jgi:ribosomal protein S18 acetylase RimI-like enzyme